MKSKLVQCSTFRSVHRGRRRRRRKIKREREYGSVHPVKRNTTCVHAPLRATARMIGEDNKYLCENQRLSRTRQAVGWEAGQRARQAPAGETDGACGRVAGMPFTKQPLVGRAPDGGKNYRCVHPKSSCGTGSLGLRLVSAGLCSHGACDAWP